MPDYGLGRKPSTPDDRDYQMDRVWSYLSHLLHHKRPKKRTSWDVPYGLDQKQTNHCVGFGCAHWGISDPVEDQWQDSDAHNIYYEAKVLDGDPKGEDGSTVRSGAKVLQNAGRLQTYVFASNIGDVERWLQDHGPVIVGTDWLQDMFSPDADGVVSVSGSVAGGHCYLLVGWDPHTGLFKAKNSWGDSWGQNGFFYIHEPDMKDLLVNGGEACASTELPI